MEAVAILVPVIQVVVAEAAVLVLEIIQELRIQVHEANHNEKHKEKNQKKWECTIHTHTSQNAHHNNIL